MLLDCERLILLSAAWLLNSLSLLRLPLSLDSFRLAAFLRFSFLFGSALPRFFLPFFRPFWPIFQKLENEARYLHHFGDIFPPQFVKQFFVRQSKINYTVLKDSPYMEYFKVNTDILSKTWIVDKLKMLNTQNMANAEEDLYRVWKDLTLNSSVGDQSKYRLITINHLFPFVLVNLVMKKRYLQECFSIKYHSL